MAFARNVRDAYDKAYEMTAKMRIALSHIRGKEYPDLQKECSLSDAMVDMPYLKGTGYYTDGDDTILAEVTDNWCKLKCWLNTSPEQVRSIEAPVHRVNEPL